MSSDSPTHPSVAGRRLPSVDRQGRPAGSTIGSAADFDRIFQQEYALQVAVESQRSEAGGPRAKDLVRILDHQQSRLSMGIAALDHRCETLPHVQRSHRLQCRHPDSDEVLTSSVSRTPGAGLEGLATMNLELASSIRQLMDHCLEEQAEADLEGVAREHEEMAWVLLALTHDGEYIENGCAPTPDQQPHAGPAQLPSVGAPLVRTC